MNFIKLKEARLAAGLTLEDVAQKLGRSRGLLSRIENGKLDPSIALLKEIAEIVGVPAREFID